MSRWAVAGVNIGPVQTARQRSGAAAEGLAAQHVAALGWQVLARNLIVGRDEIDLLCVDPGPPQTLVSVEVRSVHTSAFGAPEERVDRRKVARLYRSLAALAGGSGLDGPVTLLPRRVDLVVVDRRSGAVQLRHLRALQPP